MNIETDTHSIFYNKIEHSIIFQGSLRLNGTEDYASILELLHNIVEEEPPKIILNLKELKFLNSSGISMISKFVITVRKRKNIQMAVIGDKDIPWQGKSLKNLQRLMPNLTIELV